MNPEQIKKSIVDTLNKHSEGLTILDISKQIGVHRHTGTKYVYELIGAGLILIREIGRAKVCYLKEGRKK